MARGRRRAGVRTAGRPNGGDQGLRLGRGTPTHGGDRHARRARRARRRQRDPADPAGGRHGAGHRGLRGALPLGRQPHERHRAGAQPIRPDADPGRVVDGLRRPACDLRGRPRNRHRSGRVAEDPHVVVRLVWAQGDVRAGPVHRRLPRRRERRPRRSHGTDGRRRGAPSAGDRRRGRNRPSSSGGAARRRLRGAR